MYNKRFCKEPEKIENYEKAKANDFIGWCCHHRLETHNSDGERRIVDITKKELIALGMYYNRPAEELIFLTKSEHNILHNKGKHLTEETRRKIAEAHKGKHHTEETRRKMAESAKGKKMSEESKKKNSEAHTGKKHSEESKKKIRSTMKKLHWYNNGEINTRAKECPPGFVPGK